LTNNQLHFFWTAVRKLAEIVADARLYNPPHAHSWHTGINSELLHVEGCLLGHRRASTTNRHVHFDDTARRHPAVERERRAAPFADLPGSLGDVKAHRSGIGLVADAAGRGSAIFSAIDARNQSGAEKWRLSRRASLGIVNRMTLGRR